MKNEENLKPRGRKPEEEGKSKNKLLCTKLSDYDHKRIEELAKYLDIPKTTLTRNLILSSLEDIELLRKIDVIDVIKGVRKTNDYIKKFKLLREAKQA